jgi:DNA-directed RNA polymerase
LQKATCICVTTDSFGCPPSRAQRFQEIIREQFVKVYDQAQKDIGDPNNKRMRKARELLPEHGGLDIEQVLKAEYAFA